MSGESIPITPQVVKWAVERIGYTPEGLENQFPGISDWVTDSCTSFPTYAKLEQLADKLKVPIAVFFFPGPPDIPSIQATFKTIPETAFKEFPPRIHLLLRKAEALRLSLSELNDDENPAPKKIFRDLTLDTDTSVVEMVTQVRDYLDIPINAQIQWRNSDTAFKNWRGIFEDNGIYVFKDAFRDDSCAGFCLYDQSFPVIYVNDSTKSKEIFTLFYQLGHILFQSSGIDKDVDSPQHVPVAPSNQVERQCNEFASEFLLPKRMLDIELRDKAPNEDAAITIATRYKLSREVVLRRFFEQGLISRQIHQTITETWRLEQSPRRATSSTQHQDQIRYLGPRYINLAFQKYYQDKISECELADYLDITINDIARIEAQVATYS